VVGYARIVMLAPVAVVGQAVATAALPAFSQLRSEGRLPELDRAVLATLRASLGLALLMGAAAWALAEPVTVLLYQRGAFTPADTLSVSALLVVFAFAVPAWVTQQVAGRAFFAREDMWRPMLLGTAIAVLAIPLYRTLGTRFGGEGLAAAGVLAMSANAALLLVMLRFVHGGPPLLPLLQTLVRTLVVGIAAAAFAAWAAGLAESAPAAFALGSAAFGIVAIPGIWWLGDEAVREVVTRVLSRLRRRRG